MKKVIFTILTVMMAMSLLVLAVSAEGENICLEKDVYTETEVEGGVSLDDGNYWGALLLTDGDVRDFDSEGGNGPIGWYGAYPLANGEEGVFDIEIDLEGKYEITSVKVFPMGFLYGMNMPSDYVVQLSENDTDWVDIGGETGLSGQHSFTEPFVYECDKVPAKYIRIHITKFGSAVKDANYIYAGIAEIEAYGEKVFVPTAEPTEVPATEVPAEPTDAPAEPTDVPAAATEAPKPEEKTAKKTNILPIIIIAAVVIVAAVAVIIIVAKKKKK